MEGRGPLRWISGGACRSPWKRAWTCKPGSQGSFGASYLLISSWEAALGLERANACLLKCSPVRRLTPLFLKRAGSVAGSTPWGLDSAVQEQGRKGGTGVAAR